MALNHIVQAAAAVALCVSLAVLPAAAQQEPPFDGAGDYNPNGMVLSHIVPATYEAGQPVEIIVQLDFIDASDLTALGVEEVVPEGWVYNNLGSGYTPTVHRQMEDGSVNFAWTVPPLPEDFPLQFSYYLIPPDGAAGNAAISGLGLYYTTGGRLQSEVDTVVLHGEDTTPPEITLLGEDPMTVERGTPFSDPFVTATDNVDGDITGRVRVTGSVNTAVIGTYTLTYTVSDAAGNRADPVTRTVQVVAPEDGSGTSPGTPVGGGTGGTAPQRPARAGYGYYAGSADREAAYMDRDPDDETDPDDPARATSPTRSQDANAAMAEAARRAREAQEARRAQAQQQAGAANRPQPPTPPARVVDRPDRDAQDDDAQARTARRARETQLERARRNQDMDRTEPRSGGATTGAAERDAATAGTESRPVSQYPADAPGTRLAARTDEDESDGTAAAAADPPSDSGGFMAGLRDTFAKMGTGDYVRLVLVLVVLAGIGGMGVFAWRVAYSPKPRRKHGGPKHEEQPS